MATEGQRIHEEAGEILRQAGEARRAMAPGFCWCKQGRYHEPGL